MKNLCLLLAVLITIGIRDVSSMTCETTHQEGLQSLKTCQVKGKEIYFLNVQGSMNDLAFYHGKFLAPQINEGVLRKVLSKRDNAINSLPKKERRLFKSIYTCTMNRYKRSLTRQFKSEIKSLARGLKASGVKIDSKDLLEASLMIEMSGFIDSLQVEMQQNSSKATRKLFKTCGTRILQDTSLRSLGKVLGTLVKSFRSLKKGCTGFVAGGDYTVNDQTHLHGRNFDTGLLGIFENYTVITRHIPHSGLPYVGVHSAGLHYPGGITAFNSAGVSISIHELRSTKYKTRYFRKKAYIAPYLSNLVVKNASSLDEAIKLLKKSKQFGAWTLLVSDSKTGESASIEMAGKKIKVAKREKGLMGQANHFLHPDTQKGFYEYSINKTLESRARLAHVEKKLHSSKGEIDFLWGLNLLSGHEDFYVGKRSFGRTVSKVYTAMTHVMDTKKNIFWMSLGESMPANLSTYLGLKINFESNLEADFFTLEQTAKTHEDKVLSTPNWYSSLKLYAKSYIVHREKGQKIEGILEARELLKRASSLAQEDFVTEFPYEYMQIRLNLKAFSMTGIKDYMEDSFQNILALHQENYLAALHPYERSQILAELAKYHDLNGNRQAASMYFWDSLKILKSIKKSYPEHHFLGQLMNSLNHWKVEAYTINDIDAEELHFGTVE